MTALVGSRTGKGSRTIGEPRQRPGDGRRRRLRRLGMAQDSTPQGPSYVTVRTIEQGRAQMARWGWDLPVAVRAAFVVGEDALVGVEGFDDAVTDAIRRSPTGEAGLRRGTH